MSDDDEMISFKVNHLKALLGYLRDNYYANRDRLMKSLKDVQDKCPHRITVYHHDPSGNNDSYRSCDTCGKDDL